ncbi:MAG: aldo/keto reductase [Propionibacteriaceae bacterium]|jgi:diketogulonate reductase-like aldo/keto reductase|nr:aldo/keto reductase [Propionibacteriaceae bacterium]
MSVPTYTLNDGLEIPAIGFGTYKLRGFEGAAAIESALANGYRLLDSAMNYDNEGAVGLAVRRSAVPREQIVVTSKLPGRFHAHDLAVAAVEESLSRTGLDYLDLMLIHWPNPRVGLYVQAWQALVECRSRGLVRSIGVSNFLPEHVEAVVAATGVTPSVNQIERHPFFPQWEHLEWDAAHGIRDEAWSPLFRGNIALEAPELAGIAAAHGKTPTQVILRWHVQTGVIPIPKAAHPQRQVENISIFDFELSGPELQIVAGLARDDRRLVLQTPIEHEEM